MNAEMHQAGWYVDHLMADVERIAGVVAGGALDAPVAACPGWDVRELAIHVGMVHRWADHCAANAEPPADFDAFRPHPTTDLAEWLREGAGLLAVTLLGIDPDASTWHPFRVDKVGRVWPRRQAQETSIHRWDAERAAGIESTIDSALASDGIDEYFELVVPGQMRRRTFQMPTGSLHLHCTDIDGEWFVWNDESGYNLERTHRKGDAALRGPAAALVLQVWGREHHGPDETSRVGDPEILDSWLRIAGM